LPPGPSGVISLEMDDKAIYIVGAAGLAISFAAFWYLLIQII
jgi:hypothetical protein